MECAKQPSESAVDKFQILYIVGLVAERNTLHTHIVRIVSGNEDLCRWFQIANMVDHIYHITY